MAGVFVVSLDFELAWGGFDVRSGSYNRNLYGARLVVPQILKLFEQHSFRATWATVGGLMCNNPAELNEFTAAHTTPALSTKVRGLLDCLARNPEFNELYFAPDHVQRIRNSPGQELATHTFSHLFCLEQGARPQDLEADLICAMAVSKLKTGLEPRSIVFPRNQFSAEHLTIVRALGIGAFRGAPRFPCHAPGPKGQQTLVHRAQRYLDSYVPSSRTLIHPIATLGTSEPVDIPASLFFRPRSTNGNPLNHLRMTRIKNLMKDAATSDALFHLWWHPHNFGVHSAESLRDLESILIWFRRLADQSGYRNLTLTELADEVRASLSSSSCEPVRQAIDSVRA